MVIVTVCNPLSPQNASAETRSLWAFGGICSYLLSVITYVTSAPPAYCFPTFMI